MNHWLLKSEPTTFGIDRLALALFATHGVEFAEWPARVSQVLAI